MGRFLIAGVVLFLMACGSDAAMRSDGMIETRGEFCRALASPACTRGAECRLLGNTTEAGCESQFVTACCVGPPYTCGDRLNNTTGAAQFVDTCSAAFDNWDCTALSQGLSPPVCLTPQ